MRRILFTAIVCCLFLNKAVAQQRLQLIPEKTEVKTPKGNSFRFKTKGTKFLLQWRQGDQFKTLDYTFDTEGADSWLPYLVEENQDFLVVRAGCGSPCWTGFFLPLKNKLSVAIINGYIAYDLYNNYVAYFNKADDLEVLNLKNGKTQSWETQTCKFLFKNPCIDTLYFRKNSVYYKWHDEEKITIKTIRK